jgi:general stress protein 26
MRKLPDEKDPRDNLTGGGAIKKMQAIAETARVCLFGTHSGKTLAVRPMAVQGVDSKGNVWFLSGRTSAKNRQIARNPRVQLLFINADNAQYLNLHGVASIHDDSRTRRAHWTPLAKTWFHEGVDDPETTVIKVRIESGYYWDTEHGKTFAMLQMAVGAVTGRTFDDSVEGVVKPARRRRA